MIISNSTPLIYLSKLNRLDLIEKVYKNIIIPEAVFREVVLKGKELNQKETIIIEEFINKGTIEIKQIEEIKKEIGSIDPGEAEAISLCLKLNIKDILIDDKEAYELCRLLKINPIRTTAFLLMCANKKLISKEEFKEILVNLIKEGYFIDANVFQYLIDRVNKIK